MSKWKSSVISLGIALFFAIACYFMPSKVNLFWSLVVAAITFLISFVFVELEGYLERMHGIETNNNYRFYEECGISEYHKDFSEIDFSSCITKATHIKIVLLYSNRFISTYINSLRNFVAREGTTLEVILLSDNKEKHSYRYISDKLGYGENGLARKLAEFYQLISNDILLSKNAKSNIELYYTDFIPMYSLYMFDDYAYITLYKTAPQRTTFIPCLRIEKSQDSSFYNFLENDYSNIKKTSVRKL